jgi:hypothetical protein
MRIRVDEVGRGLHPSEVVVQIQTVERPERLIVDRRSISDRSINVGYPVGKSSDYYLIELPRETIGGAWRVWVTKEVIVGDALESAGERSGTLDS